MTEREIDHDGIRALGQRFATMQHEAGRLGLLATMHALAEAARTYGDEATALLSKEPHP